MPVNRRAGGAVILGDVRCRSRIACDAVSQKSAPRDADLAMTDTEIELN